MPISHVFYFCHIITLLTVHLLHYRLSKSGTIDNIKILEDIDYDLNGFFNTTFSKNLFEFLSLTVLFQFF